MPKSVLIVGCGDLGTALARLLVADGYEVTGLRRSVTPLPDGIHTLSADVTSIDSLSVLAQTSPEILVYCVAANASTDESYFAHYVTGFENVLARLNQSALQHVFFVSSTRVYGQVTDAILNEDTPAQPNDFGGERLLQGEQLVNTLDCPSTILRLSGIYGEGRKRMLRLAADPTNWPSHNTWTNRIHRDDAARFIHFLIQQMSIPAPNIYPCYLVTDSLPVAQYEVLQWIAQQMSVDVSGIKAPELSGGKRLSNQRILASGFRYLYPTYQAGYAALLASAIN